jgi:hypothetical protein
MSPSLSGRLLLPLLLAAAAGCAPRLAAHATYRVRETRCEACALPAQLERQLPAGSQDCGFTRQTGEEGAAARLALSECVQLAQQQRRPFHARMTLPGAEGGGEVAFLGSAEGRTAMVWTDRGGEACGGTVWRTGCARLRPHLQDATFLVCDPEGERQPLCAEPSTRHEAWTAEADAAGLSCESTPNRALVCEERITGGEPVAYKACAPSRAPAWRCTRGADAAAPFAARVRLQCEPLPGGAGLYCTEGALPASSAAAGR